MSSVKEVCWECQPMESGSRAQRGAPLPHHGDKAGVGRRRGRGALDHPGRAAVAYQQRQRAPRHQHHVCRRAHVARSGLLLGYALRASTPRRGFAAMWTSHRSPCSQLQPEHSGLQTPGPLPAWQCVFDLIAGCLQSISSCIIWCTSVVLLLSAPGLQCMAVHAYAPNPSHFTCDTHGGPAWPKVAPPVKWSTGSLQRCPSGRMASRMLRSAHSVSKMEHNAKLSHAVMLH